MIGGNSIDSGNPAQMSYTYPITKKVHCSLLVLRGFQQAIQYYLEKNSRNRTESS